MSHAARRRLTGSLFAGIAVVVVMVFLASLGSHSNPVVTGARADEGAGSEIEESVRVGALLGRLGVSPESLAAVGASPELASAVVLMAHAYFLSYPEELLSADEALGQARAEQSRLEALIQSGQGTEQNVSELGAATAAVAEAEGDVATALAVARAQTFGGLSEGQKFTLGLIRQNRAVYGDAMPVAVASDVWTDAEWIEARAGLTSVEQAADNGQDPAGAAVAAAEDAMSRGPVATAQSNLADLEQVRAAWESALAGL